MRFEYFQSTPSPFGYAKEQEKKKKTAQTVAMPCQAGSMGITKTPIPPCNAESQIPTKKETQIEIKGKCQLDA